jgi:hypothetical protein
LKAAGLTAGDLDNLKGSDARKAPIARVIHRQTTIDMPWLARHLSTRSPEDSKLLPKALKTWINLSRIVA